MRWDLQWGDKLDFLQNQVAPHLAAQGGRSKVLDSRPSIQPHLIPVWDAYTSLDRDRLVGMGGPGPIPFSSIDLFARRYGIEDIAEFDRFRRLIMAMDAEYLKFVAERIEQETKKGKPQ